MSTEIKNTLFSFVTMRAPELSNENEKEKRFVFRAVNVKKGDFDTAVEERPVDKSKWEAMQLASMSFTAFDEETDVSDLNPDLFRFAVWIARNSANYDKEALDSWLALVTKLDADSDSYAKLWDNLFYQVITQKDFYIKEAIIQVLVANNFIEHFKDKPEVIKDLMNATVVLPKSLFGDIDGASGVAGKKAKEEEYKPSYPDAEMAKTQRKAYGTIYIERYKNLSKEILGVEKKYRKQYDIEYRARKEDYDLKNKTLWDDYTREVEEAKKSFCTVRNPEIPYDPNNPCEKPKYIAEPELDAFEFTFQDELDIPFLQKHLTPMSFDMLMEIVGLGKDNERAKKLGESLDGTITSYDTFSDIIQLTEELLGQQKKVISDSTSLKTPNYFSYGGVLVPMTSRTTSPFFFNLCYKTLTAGYVNFDLTFDVPDNSWQVANFYCTAKFSDATSNTNGSPNPFPVIPVNQSVSITNIFNDGISPANFTKLTSLEGNITFSNGCVKTFLIEGGFDSATCVKGPLRGDCNSDSGSTIGSSDNTTLFIPSGHGFKQLGIADYKVVEQTVHCYVEGEVAHIENVMARERREKSTRRLTRTEDTLTEKSEQERESITDTATTERYEMQNEVSKLIQQSMDLNAATQFNVKGARWDLSATAGFATHSTREQNTRQAITNAKEIVQKATERLTNKITEERIKKIVEEFEESNIHEFDNRKGDRHVVGVYRWVDKIYKNQVVNYGKRLMFEFMIPEPAKLHKLGMKGAYDFTPSGILTEPIDPRTYTADGMNLSDYSKITEETVEKWAGMYNVEFEPKPLDEIYVGKTIAIEKTTDDESVSKSDSIKIDSRYRAVGGKVLIAGNYDGDHGDRHNISALFGNGSYDIASSSSVSNPGPNQQTTPGVYIRYGIRGVVDSGNYQPLSGFKDEVPISLQYYNYHTGSVSYSIKCELTSEARMKWQQETFKAIIDGYEEALAAYNDKLAEEKEKATANADTNPAFFRQMMNVVLRKNCISYLIDQSTSAMRTYGKDMTNGGASFGSYEVKVDSNLDDYGAFVKFMEQAFEWDIMSYYFYPFYWANRTEWQKMYQYNESDDPLFRSFMQSGMARAIVTVRPGFEKAVRFYLQTGKIWNGGEVPVIDDKLFLAIIEELAEPEGKKEGLAWATRVPTSLTILQANSIGLEVEKALPCNCEDLRDFENPEDVPCGDNFLLNNSQINGATGTAKLFGKITGNDGLISRVMLKTLAGLVQDVTLTNEDGEWELKNIPAGSYDLLLDATNVFPEDEYTVISGEKNQTVTLLENQEMEVDLKIEKIV